MGFTQTTRKVVSVVFILIALAFAFAMLNKLYEFYLFQDSWFLSQALARGLFVGLFGGIAWLAHPPDDNN